LENNAGESEKITGEVQFLQNQGLRKYKSNLAID